MRLAKPLRNDHVEALAEHLGRGKAEEGFGGAVPHPDHSLTIGVDHRVRPLLHERAEQLGCRCRVLAG